VAGFGFIMLNCAGVATFGLCNGNVVPKECVGAAQICGTPL